MWKFENIYKETIWGGDRIGQYVGESLSSMKIGECWQLSSVDDSLSVVSSTKDRGLTITELIERYGTELLGKKNYLRFGTRFPLLIKIIDACENLSVQVHPDDRLARMRGELNGKAEMWYVLGCTDHATLINGFKEQISPEKYTQLVASGELMNHLRFSKIKKGDAYYLPAGRVHALGSGVMVVEIQQTSDLTYRIYDYDRKDASGQPRELHLELAYDAIDFTDKGGKAINYVRRNNFPVCLVSEPHFTINLMQLDSEILRDYSEWDTFVALVATSGKALLRSGEDELYIKAGETVLIPAKSKGLVIHPEGEFEALEAYVK
ncbi:MAG: class I mannose-6-phosphate isomerase [Muribaculaceae bacterium]|nr:class I mannose-6-phosphate isomerase [Muribaculaceae bacterium]